MLIDLAVKSAGQERHDRTKAVLRPYLKNIHAWQKQAAYLRGLRESSHLLLADRAALFEKMQALRTAVHQGAIDFRSAVAGADLDPHRVHEVTNAMTQLVKLVETLVRQ